MKILNILSILLFLCLQGLDAKPNSTSSKLNIDPPSNLHATEIGTSWANLVWTPVPGASQYIFKTYDRTTGALVHSATVAGNVTTLQVTWPDNSSRELETLAWSVDDGGRQSRENAYFPFKGIILELVVIGFTTNYSVYPTVCNVVNYANSCSKFPWSSTPQPFKVHKSGFPYSIYTIKGVDNKFTMNIEGNESNYSYFEDDFNFTIKYTGETIVTLQPYLVISPLGNYGQLYRSGANNNTFLVSRMEPSNPLSNGGVVGVRSEDPVEPTTFSPNPFTDLLTVELPVYANQPETIVRLVDLLGAEKMRINAAAGQEELNLQTAELTPGVYFLRIDSGDIHKTVKVLKAQ